MIRTALIDILLCFLVIGVVLAITAFGTGLLMLPIVIAIWATGNSHRVAPDDLWTAYLWLTGLSFLGVGAALAWRAFAARTQGIK